MHMVCWFMRKIDRSVTKNRENSIFKETIYSVKEDIEVYLSRYTDVAELKVTVVEATF